MRILIVGSFLFFLLAGSYGCQSSPDPVEVQGSTFFYYPRPNIYYDLEQKKYYVWDPLQSIWGQHRELPPDLAATLGKKVLLDSVGVPVYKDNAHHRLIYSAALYASPQEVQRKFREDSLSSVPQKPPVALKPLPEEKEEKEGKRRKTRVGRFLERIFHKSD